MPIQPASIHTRSMVHIYTHTAVYESEKRNERSIATAHTMTTNNNDCLRNSHRLNFEGGEYNTKMRTTRISFFLLIFVGTSNCSPLFVWSEKKVIVAAESVVTVPKKKTHWANKKLDKERNCGIMFDGHTHLVFRFSDTRLKSTPSVEVSGKSNNMLERVTAQS